MSGRKIALSVALGVCALLLACGGGSKTSGMPGAPGSPGSPSSAQNHFVFVANKDKASVTELTIDPSTGAATVPSGTDQTNVGGPATAVVTDPSGSHVYIASSSGIAAFSIASNGSLTPISGSPFALAGASPTDLAIDPNGKFLYVAFNGSNQVASYPINATDGSLGAPMTAGTGSGPIAVITDPSGQFVYVTNQNSFTISGFTVDANTGALTAISGSPFNASPTSSPTTGPTAMAVVHNFLYVASDGQILTLSINTSSGALSSSGTPFSATTVIMAPHTIAVDPAGNFLIISNITPDTSPNFLESLTINSSNGQLSTGPTFNLANSTVTASPIAIDASGSHLYAISFLDPTCVSSCENAVLTFSVSSSGSLSPVGSASDTGAMQSDAITVH